MKKPAFQSNLRRVYQFRRMAHPHLRESYCLRTLERIHVTDRVIHRTQKLVEDTQAKLERILSEIEKERLLRDKIQENEAKIRSLSSQLLRLQLDLQDREKVHDSNNQFLLDISDDMHVLREQMRCDYKCLEEKKLSLADDKKKFYSCNYALLMRRNQLVTELFQIYPIHHSQGKNPPSIRPQTSQVRLRQGFLFLLCNPH